MIMIKLENYLYKVGDEVKDLFTNKIYKVIEVKSEEKNIYGFEYTVYNFKLKSSTKPYKSKWIKCRALYNNYEPTNNLIKILYASSSEDSALLEAMKARQEEITRVYGNRKV